MSTPTKPGLKTPARAKKPIGRVCLPCGGKGWTAPSGVKGSRPAKKMCSLCNGKGRVQ